MVERKIESDVDWSTLESSDMFLILNPSDLEFNVYGPKTSKSCKYKIDNSMDFPHSHILSHQLKVRYRNSYEILVLWDKFRSFLDCRSDMRFLDTPQLSDCDLVRY